MFKKINIIANGSALAIVSALVAHFHYSENVAALALAGIVIIVWHNILQPLKKKKSKKTNIQE